MRSTTLLAAALPLSVSCSEVELGEHVSEVVVDNGRGLNGRGLNGRGLNGSTLGTEIIWTSLEGIQLNGATLQAAWLEGTELVGRNGNGSEVRGFDFHQSELAARTDEGHDIKLRVRDMAAPADGSDQWLYWLEYQETDSSWVPTCLDGVESAPSTAIEGWWDVSTAAKQDDPSRITFACPTNDGAIGKCVALGYQPWSSVSETSLDGHHQSCVRAMRADYCGDGTSYTTDGKVINIYDGLGVQIDTEDWRIEAEWDPEGARCFSNNNRALSHLPCFRNRSTNGCGRLEHFEAGTLLMTEMPND